MSALPEIPSLNPSLCVCEWTSFTTRQDFYLIHLFFSASLKFKCMQWSKPPFRKKRWCNKQKPPVSPQPPASHRRCTQQPLCYGYQTAASLAYSEVLLQSATRGQECLGEFFFPPLLPSCSPHAFFSVVCPSAWNNLRYIAAKIFIHTHENEIHVNNIDCFCSNLVVSHTQEKMPVLASDPSCWQASADIDIVSH